ncbi:MAG: carboxymuconolactone decarboxylase family protein [Candidatus Hodarchaeota archaeon]
MIEKEIIKRKRLSVPRVMPAKYSEWDEGEKKDFLMRMTQIFKLSEPSQFFELDVSKLDVEKINFLEIIALNVSRTGRKYEDLFPHLSPYYLREQPKPSISDRERELCIIRTGWLCQADYECIHHIFIGLIIGFTAEEIIRILKGPDAAGWSLTDTLILRTADELHENYFICDDTWSKLSENYNEKQILELILIIGHYTKLAMFLNSTGVQIDSQHQGFGKLSEKMNNDDRVKISNKAFNLLTEIYYNEILKEDFTKAKNSLNLLVQTEEFKITKNLSDKVRGKN